MLQKIFDLPIYQSSVTAHKESKEGVIGEIERLIKDSRSYNLAGNERVYSDYMYGDDPSTRKYKDAVIESIEPNVVAFIKLMGAKEIEFGQIWFQRYETHSFHGAHNHWPSLFSAVYYLEFDPEEHKETVFMNPNRLQIELYQARNINLAHEFSPRAKEGDLVIFPSFLDHYAPMNISEKPRTIISFNFNLNG